MAVRGVGRGWALLDRSLETSGQLAIRIAVVMVFALGALASHRSAWTYCSAASWPE